MAENVNYQGFEGTKLPFSAEAEQSVLGSILLDPSSYNLIGDILRAEHFYIPQNRAIYETISAMSLTENSGAIDYVTVLEMLKNNKAFDESTAKTYLAKIMESVPSAKNIRTYAEIVRDKYYVRSLITASRDIIDEAQSGSDNAASLIDVAEQKIFDIRQGSDSKGLVSVKDVVFNETYDRLNKLSNEETKKDFIGIPCGFPEINRTLTGLNKSDLIIVGARPGVGKTAFCLNIARHVALNEKKRVCVFSLEMSRDQLAQRMISDLASVESEKLRSAELSPDEWARITQAGKQLSESDMFFDETSTVTVPEIRARLMRMRPAADLVIVDYLGLITPVSETSSRANDVSAITRQLKILAKSLKVPVIVCAQLNRGPASKSGQVAKKPALADLRESGSIEQDADIVMFLYKEDENNRDGADTPYDAHKVECIIAKNRHGETRNVNLYWDGRFTRFSPVTNYDE